MKKVSYDTYYKLDIEHAQMHLNTRATGQRKKKKKTTTTTTTATITATVQ